VSSSIPEALDWLVGQIRDAVGPGVAVSDGWPAVRSDDLIAIGVTPEGDDATLTGSYAELGGGAQYEAIEIPAIIICRRAGTDAAKAARDAAFALFDQVNDLVAADRRLGDAVRPGLPARVVRWQVAQTADVRQAGEGRVCEIRWILAWTHRR